MTDFSNLVCSVCRKDISQSGYCLDGVLYCPEHSWQAEHPQQQLALFEDVA